MPFRHIFRPFVKLFVCNYSFIQLTEAYYSVVTTVHYNIGGFVSLCLTVTIDICVFKWRRGIDIISVFTKTQFYSYECIALYNTVNKIDYLKLK